MQQAGFIEVAAIGTTPVRTSEFTVAALFTARKADQSTFPDKASGVEAGRH
jgi:hypothetical protein